jgi:HK97 family phage prohead protease
MSKKRFVFNDERIYNTYGFRIANAGVNLVRFNQNPVMLNDHWGSTHNVIGLWEDVRVEGTTLGGAPVFDTEDEDAAKVAGKVERGFVKACSMGILFREEHLTLESKGKYLLEQCELLEVSIVAIPSNANAVRLFVDRNGNIEELKENEIKGCLSALETDNLFKNNNNNMKKILLSVAALVALGLDKIANPSEGVDASVVENAINDLKTKLDNAEQKLSAAQTALKAHEDKADAEKKTSAAALVDAAIPNKLDAAQREDMIKLAIADYGFAKKLIDGMPEKQKLSGKVDNKGAASTGEVKTMEDFQKLSVSAQLAFKSEHPEDFTKLVESM